MEILVWVRLHAMMTSCIQKICSFFKKRKCARKICTVFVTLSDFNKTSNRAVTTLIKWMKTEVFYCKSDMRDSISMEIKE